MDCCKCKAIKYSIPRFMPNAQNTSVRISVLLWPGCIGCFSLSTSHTLMFDFALTVSLMQIHSTLLVWSLSTLHFFCLHSSRDSRFLSPGSFKRKSHTTQDLNSGILYLAMLDTHPSLKGLFLNVALSGIALFEWVFDDC